MPTQIPLRCQPIADDLERTRALREDLLQTANDPDLSPEERRRMFAAWKAMGSVINNLQTRLEQCISSAPAQVDLLVLTPKAYTSALQPLVNHKNATGIMAKMISVEDIYETYPGRDQAEKIKRCLALHKQVNDISYAMLVGGADQFPVRYTRGQHENPAAMNVGYGASDLYYADLFKIDGTFDDWDRNQNGFYGELRGEVTGGTVNIDEVDLHPDIAVGRLPVSSLADVTRYVQKVIKYETNTSVEFANKALLISQTMDFEPDACRAQEFIAANYLAGRVVNKLYVSENPCLATTVPNPQQVSNYLNSGVGFVSYIGHGEQQGWPGVFFISDMVALNNANALPVIFSMACDTAWFTKNPPYDAYVDVNGVNHIGINQGEVFTSPPPQPACIQPMPPFTTIALEFTMKRNEGAIAWIGCITGSQAWGIDLAKFFFGSMYQDTRTLGDMWKKMVAKYYQVHVPPLTVDPPDWYRLAEFHQPWKFQVFGDPSLRIAGLHPMAHLHHMAEIFK